LEDNDTRNSELNGMGPYNPYSNEARSNALSDFNQTEKGKEIKIKSHAKRSITMAEKREELRKQEFIVCKYKDCGELKHRDEFGNKKAAANGKQTYCKECVNKNKIK
jgi:hypothetical protein